MALDGKKEQWLFVCTGNTCRSPMAEGMCNHLCAARGVPVIAVSAGLAAAEGEPAAANAVTAAARYGADLSRHRAQNVQARHCQEADRIWCMTERHAAALRTRFPAFADKIAVLDPPVPDPFGGSPAQYAETAAELARFLRRTLTAIPIIMPLNAYHLDDVHAIETICFTEAWSYRLFADELNNADARYLVALLDGHPVGYAGGFHAADSFEITKLAVSPAYRRKGIGARLLRALLDALYAAGTASVFLEVRAGNTAARTLYRAFQFCETGVRAAYYQNPAEDAVLMERSLHSA